MAFFQASDHFRMHYEVHPGLLPHPTLFIHGNLASNRWWNPTREELTKKAKGQDWSGAMITAEFMGCGQSTSPRSAEDVNMRDFARNFIDLVKSLNIGPVDLVGHSTGGIIVALMLAMEPSLFRRAVLLDPVGAKGVKFNDSMIGAFEAMKTDRSLVAVVMGSTIYKNDADSDYFQQVIVEDAFSAVKTVGHFVLKALDGLDSTAEVSSISHPVLVLHGKHDSVLPQEDSFAMAGLMAKGQFELLPDNGHCANVETPSQWVARIEKFLF